MGRMKSFRARATHRTTRPDPVTGIGTSQNFNNGQPTNSTNESFIKRKKPKINPNSTAFTKQQRRLAQQRHTMAMNKSKFLESSDNRMELLDFNRKSYESYYNHYYNNDLGMTKSDKIAIKGLKFYDNFNNLVAEVEVERLNDKNMITKFFVDSKYKGMGFAKDLLDAAKISLSANSAKIDNNDESKIKFLIAHGFNFVGKEKQHTILAINDKSKNTPTNKPMSVEKFNGLTSGASQYDFGRLYDTKGLEYEGYRDYI